MTGFAGDIDTAAILRRRITLQGIYVGSVAMLRDLVRLGLHPVIDQDFDLSRSAEACAALASARHFG